MGVNKAGQSAHRSRHDTFLEAQKRIEAFVFMDVVVVLDYASSVYRSLCIRRGQLQSGCFSQVAQIYLCGTLPHGIGKPLYRSGSWLWHCGWDFMG